MISQSSITAYNESVKDGTIPTQNRRIVELLKSVDYPMSNRMIARILKLETSAVAGRINGLMDSDIVVKAEPSHRQCPISGKRVRFVQIAWPQQMEMKI